MALLECSVFEVFFGGARGGGKTDGMLGEWIRHADLYGPNAIGLMLRRTRTELIETIERSRAIYSLLGWKYKVSRVAKTPAQIASYAREFTDEAINTLAHCMRAPKAPWPSRIMAASILIDRGWGKAPVTIQGEVTHRYVVEMPAELTRDEWIKQYSTPMIESKPE
jgi:hypothetical protein